jgi:hypothetical protein
MSEKRRKSVYEWVREDKVLRNVFEIPYTHSQCTLPYALQCLSFCTWQINSLRQRSIFVQNEVYRLSKYMFRSQLYLSTTLALLFFLSMSFALEKGSLLTVLTSTLKVLFHAWIFHETV